MSAKLANKKGEIKNPARDAQRYHWIKWLAHMQGMSVIDLHRRYCDHCQESSLKGCHYSVFYRVCQGNRKSDRIQGWIARTLRTSKKELWA